MKSKSLQVIVVVLVMLVVGYFVLAQLKLTDLARLWQESNLLFLLLGFVAYLLANVLRALRFRTLIDGRLGTGQLLRTVFLQNFLNTFLPLRAGEASYLLVVHRTGKVKPGDNIGSLLGARVLDLVAALFIPLLTLPLSRVQSTQAIGWFVGALVVSILALAAGIWHAEALANKLRALSERRRGWLQRGLVIASDALLSCARLRQASLLGRIAALTFGCWALIYLCGYASLLGVGIKLKFWDALFAYSFPMIASMTPFFMLGGFGVFEASTGVGLNLVGVPLNTAVAGALLLHLAELVYVVLPAPFGLFASRARPLEQD